MTSRFLTHGPQSGTARSAQAVQRFRGRVIGGKQRHELLGIGSWEH
jgi:hypothetical protein